jgi:hypothetical protein
MKRSTVWGSQKPHELRIRRLTSDDLQTKIHDAIAWRAYELYEARGGAGGHDAEDWKQAEAEMVRPLPCGFLEQDHRVCLTADASHFDQGPIELWIEPRRLTLCGFDGERRPLPVRPAEPARPRRDWLFLVHDFAVELDPAAVTAHFNGPALDIYVGKARAASSHRMAAVA